MGHQHCHQCLILHLCSIRTCLRNNRSKQSSRPKTAAKNPPVALTKAQIQVIKLCNLVAQASAASPQSLTQTSLTQTGLMQTGITQIMYSVKQVIKKHYNNRKHHLPGIALRPIQTVVTTVQCPNSKHLKVSILESINNFNLM